LSIVDLEKRRKERARRTRPEDHKNKAMPQFTHKRVSSKEEEEELDETAPRSASKLEVLWTRLLIRGMDAIEGPSLF